MNVLITGATGMVGSEVLTRCLAEDKITHVLAVGRRKCGVTDAKLSEVEHDDFLDYALLENRLAHIDACFFCIGVYQNSVSKDEFWRVTVDYPKALIEAFERASNKVRFCLFSAQGASSSEKSPIRFAKAKGRAENILLASGLTEKYVFRPGFIRSGPAKRGAIAYEKWFVPAYKLFPRIGIDAPDLARVMVDVGINGHAQTIFENRDLRAYGTGSTIGS
ncbi:MAG: NAD(P)H-binding protein [Rhodospirillales bacterium]|nr:NAD(P)H-binding protein [Rhodospirillales bacterium]